MSDQAKTPKWADESAIGGMKEKSQALVNTVKEKTGPALMRAIDVIGAGSQKKMAAANDLMSNSVNSLLKGLDGKSPTGEKLLELRGAMDDLNPHSLNNAWWFSWMPKGIKRKAVSRFIHKYEPMQKHVNGILSGLRAGKDDLLETSIELENQYTEIEAAQKEIQSEIYIGEIFITEVEKLESETDATDAQELQKLASVKNKAARRIRDLRTMEQAAVQFFISIDQTVATNELLSEQIDSALTVGPMVMTNALRIQAALAKQDTVKQAVQSFQEGLGDMMAQNAAAVNKAASEIGDLYNNPVIALEKMEEGFDQLMQAVNTANETMANSTIKAREASAKLAEMTAELSPVAQGLRDAKDNDDYEKQAKLESGEKVIEGEVIGKGE
ncbi:MAG: toxic anion resistance protein [Gammaproteobacteria bacterium]|nr:toxic anion resistance protein [Gammaproteobacteria bacterium]